MNKLAPIALILLLSFGGALWYLANNSLNEHIRARIIQVGEYYTELTVSVDAVDVKLSQGTGKISGLRLLDAKQSDKSIITIKNVIFTFEPAHIKKNKIIIDDMTFTDIYAHMDKEDIHSQMNIKPLLELLNSKIALIRDARKQKAEPYIEVKQIKLKNTIIATGYEEKKEHLHKLAPVGASGGLPSSLFGIEIFRKILEHTNNS
jgi:hypothetical protein